MVSVHVSVAISMCPFGCMILSDCVCARSVHVCFDVHLCVHAIYVCMLL